MAGIWPAVRPTSPRPRGLPTPASTRQRRNANSDACRWPRISAAGRCCAMKAMLSKRPGGPETLGLEELPDPVPAVNEVVIAVKACGVNYPDVLIIEDRY